MCKSALRIPRIPEEELRVNENIYCKARLAKKKQEAPEPVGAVPTDNIPASADTVSIDDTVSEDDVEALLGPTPNDSGTTSALDGVFEADASEMEPNVSIPSSRDEGFESLGNQSSDPVATEENVSQVTNDPIDESTAPEHLSSPLPSFLSRSKTEEAGQQEPPEERLASPLPKTSSGETFVHLNELSTDEPQPIPGFELDTNRLPVEPVDDRTWEQRLQDSNSDRRILARFFAICLCVVALVNMIPAIYQWYHWTQLADNVALPRWIYIQVLVGTIYMLYALFLSQIPDWSALRAVAVAILAMAFVFAIVSTGLVIGGGQGSFTNFLGIPFSLNRQACIWCVAMFCLATLMAYWGGKESMNWQRAEDLLKEILSRNPATAS